MRKVLSWVVILLCVVASAQGQAPTVMPYSGRLVIQRTNYNGTARFKFVIGNADMTTTYWSNDGSSTSGSEPASGVNLVVDDGLYRVALGDSSLANMDPLPTSVFTNSETYLGVWVDDGFSGARLLEPVQRIGSSPYAIRTDEMDPVFSASAAAGITSADTTQWTQAYGWGDHALADYATGMPLYVDDDSSYATGTPLYVDDDSGLATGTPVYVEADPTFQISPAAGLTAVNTSQWAELYSWGNHASVGYLTSAVTAAETDPIWTHNRQNGFTVHGPVTNKDVVNLRRAGYLQFDTGPSRIAIGVNSFADDYSIAIGDNTRATTGGVAIGTDAIADNGAIALGYKAKAANRNIALGMYSCATGGSNRIAIGYEVTNQVDNSCAVKGTFYIDGGTGVLYRSTVGQGSWHAKAFTIDHPLDPENKVLRHFCQESPQVWNVYSGNAQLRDGKATVALPDYYTALNLAGSEVYELASIGAAATLWIESEVADNQFVIAGSHDVEVSWDIIVLRNDPGCLKDLSMRPVEQLKSEIVP